MSPVDRTVVTPGITPFRAEFPAPTPKPSKLSPPLVIVKTHHATGPAAVQFFPSTAPKKESMETSAITDRDLLELVAKVAGVEVLWKRGEWQLVGAPGVNGTRSPTMVMRCGWRCD